MAKVLSAFKLAPSTVDEGVEQVLDILEQKAGVHC
jgi:hypothetical protein